MPLMPAEQPAVAPAASRGVPTIAAAARAVLATQYARIRKHAPGVLQDTDPEHVHDMRVAIRRARCALKLFGPWLDDAACRPVRRELSWLAGLLGGVRDNKKSRDALRACCLAARAPAFVRLQDGMLSIRYAHTLKALAHVLQPPHPVAADTSGPAAREGVRILRALITCTLKAAPAHVTPHALHGMRIQCKKMRYACEFLAPQVGEEVRDLAKQLARVQDCLGRHQDAQVTQTFLRRCAAMLMHHGEMAPEPLLMIGALVQCEREVAAQRRAAFASLCEAFVRQAKRVRARLGERRHDEHVPPSSPQNAPDDNDPRGLE
ncbi:MAG: CHAD domain-containing protein [bacterium]|nr:CHAD domain-containing protein [bacterium]